MLPIVEIIRIEENFKYGTFGVVKINKQAFSVCLEPADLENKQNVSSVPVQQYLCQRYSSAKYPDTFQITNVPNRSKVLFHAGNYIKDTEGCVLLAQYFSKLKGNRAVLNSGLTFKSFMNMMIGIDKFHLTMLENY